MKRIYRSTKNKKIAGVCGGIGEIYDIDPTIVRIAAVFLTAATTFWPGIIAYAAAWFIVPEKSDVTGEREV